MTSQIIGALSTEERARLYNLQRARCDLYEPLSDSEGRCCVNQELVSRSDGCNSPETCDILNRLNLNNK